MKNEDYWYTHEYFSGSVVVNKLMERQTFRDNMQHKQITTVKSPSSIHTLKQIGLLKPKHSITSSSSSCPSNISHLSNSLSPVSPTSSSNHFSLHKNLNSSSPASALSFASSTCSSYPSSTSLSMIKTTATNSNKLNVTKIRLNSISIKNLTLIELKYLKQICFNKLQKQLDLLVKLKRNSLITNNTSSNNLNLNTSTVASTIRITIPNDESMEMMKKDSLYEASGNLMSAKGEVCSSLLVHQMLVRIRQNVLNRWILNFLKT